MQRHPSGSWAAKPPGRLANAAASAPDADDVGVVAVAAVAAAVDVISTATAPPAVVRKAARVTSMAIASRVTARARATGPSTGRRNLTARHMNTTPRTTVRSVRTNRAAKARGPWTSDRAPRAAATQSPGARNRARNRVVRSRASTSHMRLKSPARLRASRRPPLAVQVTLTSSPRLARRQPRAMSRRVPTSYGPLLRRSAGPAGARSNALDCFARSELRQCGLRHAARMRSLR